MSTPGFHPPSGQRGVATIEFALIASAILLPLLFGIIEFGRIAFYWNAATEATRLGARLAVVCDLDDATIKSRMSALFPVVTDDMIALEYKPDGCATTNCQQVKVTVKPVVMPTYIPYFSFSPSFPPFATTLPRESMRSSFGEPGKEVENPVCQ